MKSPGKTLFPFICAHKGCSKAYDSDGFKAVALKQGYILLTNEKSLLIGITCQECMNTTIHNHTTDVLKQITDLLPDSELYVPFKSPEKLALNRVEDQKPLTVPSNIDRIDLMFIPHSSIEDDIDYWKKYIYPPWFLKECSFSYSIDEIEKIVEFENAHKTRVLPRIINAFSPYQRSDRLIPCYEKREFLSKEAEKLAQIERVNEFFILSANTLPSAFGREDEFTEEERSDFITKYKLKDEYPPEFVEAMPEILRDYLGIRSNFGFEDIYVKTFLRKYIMKFYHAKGYSKSTKRVHDKAEHEEFYGKERKTINFIGDTDEIVTDVEILNRWRKGKAILKRLIVNRDLPAYGPDGILIDPLSPEIQNGKFDPSDFVYLKSEVKETEVLIPSLMKEAKNEKDPQNESDLKEKTYTRDKEAELDQPPVEMKNKIPHSKNVQLRCIEVADSLWVKAQKNGDTILSTGAMAQHHDIVKIAKMRNGNPYKKDTIQKWLSDTGKNYGADAPGTRPGTKKRPPK